MTNTWIFGTEVHKNQIVFTDTQDSTRGTKVVSINDGQTRQIQQIKITDTYEEKRCVVDFVSRFLKKPVHIMIENKGNNKFYLYLCCTDINDAVELRMEFYDTLMKIDDKRPHDLFVKHRRKFEI